MNHHFRIPTSGRSRPCLFMSLAVVLLLNFALALVGPAVAAPPIDPALPSAGTYTVALSADATGLDPALEFDTTSLLVASQIYDTLFVLQPGGSLTEPGLVESWTLSPDRRTWTLTLRPGLLFHDGTNLNAAAVVTNIQRWWDPAHPYHNGQFPYFEYIFGGFKGDPNCLLTDVTAVGTNQVRLSLREADSRLLAYLTLPAFGIASPAAIQGGNLAQWPVGSGPYRMGQRIVGQSITLNAWAHYWRQPPYFDTLVFQIIPDAATRFAAVQSNTVQSADGLPSSYSALAAADPNLAILWRPPVALGYLGINRAHTPLNNPLVQQAIAHAIDKTHIVSASYGSGTPIATQLVPPGIWGYLPNLVDYAYDPARARALLAQAGFPQGFSIDLALRNVSRPYMPNPLQTASLLQADLEAVGIQATVTVYDSGTFLTKMWNGELDLFLIGWITDYLHPYNWFGSILCDTYLAYGPRDNPLCSAIEATLVEADPNGQIATYRWAAQRVHDTLPLVPIAYPGSFTVTRKNVAGLVLSPDGMDQYRYVFYATARVYLPRMHHR